MPFSILFNVLPLKLTELIGASINIKEVVQEQNRRGPAPTSAIDKDHLVLQGA